MAEATPKRVKEGEVGVSIASSTAAPATGDIFDDILEEERAEKSENELSQKRQRVVVFNVGQGSCLAAFGKRGCLIVDCGSLETKGAEKATIVKRITNELDNHFLLSDPLHIIVSHCDHDHHCLVMDVLTHVASRGRTGKVQLWLGGKREHYVNIGCQFVGLPGSGDAYESKFPPFALGTTPGVIGTGLVDDRAEPDLTNNDQSLVVRIELNNGKSMIVSGDATQRTHASLADQDVQTDIFVADHHGSSSHGSNSEDWLKRLRASTVIFSSGTTQFKHPRKKVIQRAIESGFLACEQQSGHFFVAEKGIAQFEGISSKGKHEKNYWKYETTYNIFTTILGSIIITCDNISCTCNYTCNDI